MPVLAPPADSVNPLNPQISQSFPQSKKWTTRKEPPLVIPHAYRLYRRNRPDAFHFGTHCHATSCSGVSHRALHVFVPHPPLHQGEIFGSPNRSSAKGRSEFMQPDRILVNASASSDSFQPVEEIEFRQTVGSGEQQPALATTYQHRFQLVDEVLRHLNRPLLIHFR